MRVETAAEIIAKKMWHRGDRVTARDLFDLALVAQLAPESLNEAGRFIVRHRDAFLAQLQTRKPVLQMSFDEIDVMAGSATFDECVTVAQEYLQGLP